MNLFDILKVSFERHDLLNPFSEKKLDEVVDLLDLPRGGRVLDLGCGKGEVLCRVCERWETSGVGVDVSRHWVADAREKGRLRGLDGTVQILQGNAAEFDGDGGPFDATLCFGTSFIFGGFAKTLGAVTGWTLPGGIIVVGEPFWMRPPSPEYLAASGHKRESFGTHAGNVRTGLDAGLGFLHAVVSSQDDWDWYEGLQWYSSQLYLRDHPDTDLAREIREHGGDRYRDAYLRWGRDELGWAVYLFHKPKD